MGLITLLKMFARVGNRSETTVDPGGGSNVTADHFADPGDDSYPLPDDYVAIISNARTGGSSAVGYAETVTTKKAGPGEKRIYSRDASTGAVVAEIWLQDDGTILLENSAGSIILAPNGDVNINGVVIDAGGGITAPGSLVLNGKELDGHIHPAGTVPGNTGPNS